MPDSAAFFDLDGTLVDSNIVRYAAEVRAAGRGRAGRGLTYVRFLPRVPYYAGLDLVSRERFQRTFYRSYRGMRPEVLALRARTLFREHVRPRLFEAGVARIEAHREKGDRIVLVSGSIEPIVAPVASHLGVDDVLTTRLEVLDGAYTGRIEGELVAGDGKAAAVEVFAEEEGISLARSSAYGDSMDDVPLLESVGKAAVVNPGRRLHATARSRGWGVFVWDNRISAQAPTTRG